MTTLLSPPIHSSASPPAVIPPISPPISTPPLESARRPAPSHTQPQPSQQQPQTQTQQMSSSRPPSTTTTTPFPNFQSALAYTLVRDFAWPDFHPLHHGAPDLDSTSGATTPASEWPGGSSRRLSDPSMDVGNGGGGWSAGPWGGDGVMYGDPESSEETGIEALPATSFGEEGEEESAGSGRRKHRKSRSYANMTDYERGRRRESAQNNSFRRSRASGAVANAVGLGSSSGTGANEASRGAGGAGGEGTGGDIFTFHGLSSQSQSQYDPAGRDSLRQSRGYINTGPSTNLSSSSSLSAEAASARSRADSHFQTMLPSRSFGARDRRSRQQQQDSSSAGQPPGTPFDPDTHMPLDTEAPLLPTPQNLRESLGPEDEELYAGRSLALYPFEPENSNELRLREGQVIMVSYRHGQGWLVAEDAETGEQGLVPEEYVRLLSELPHYDERTGTFMDPEEGEDLGGVGEEDGEGSGGLDSSGVEVDTEEVEVGNAGYGGGYGGKGKETRVDTPESGVEGEVHEMGGGEVVGAGGR
ncbi:HOG (high osmolarity glycerol) pathway protein [Elasticomyces elasticus]|nr:HOG (high osmolarity glycerol) pathway protein [Elasticomyces elasticus]KAK4975391.1 HOG (high osmolarity glycerol) pathway protein [Elasticomyces elasticus]